MDTAGDFIDSTGQAAWIKTSYAVCHMGGLSMDQAVRRVEQQYHARVVKAEAQQANGHTVYSLRLLNDSGKVWTVHVDAASGAVL